MDMQQQLGLTDDGKPLPADTRQQRLLQVNLQLVASGLPSAIDGEDAFVGSAAA